MPLSIGIAGLGSAATSTARAVVSSYPYRREARRRREAPTSGRPAGAFDALYQGVCGFESERTILAVLSRGAGGPTPGLADAPGGALSARVSRGSEGRQLSRDVRGRGSCGHGLAPAD